LSVVAFSLCEWYNRLRVAALPMRKQLNEWLVPLGVTLSVVLVARQRTGVFCAKAHCRGALSAASHQEVKAYGTLHNPPDAAGTL
jgi:hypothetical protein